MITLLSIFKKSFQSSVNKDISKNFAVANIIASGNFYFSDFIFSY